jgi:hypothetical protein
MYCIIPSRIPQLVSGIRTLHQSPNRTTKLLRPLGTPAYARLFPDVHRPCVSHARFFSSTPTMDPLIEGKRLTHPALFSHVTGSLMGMKALIPTTIRVVDGSVATP